MRIFKFGGASVKDAAGVKNVVSVLKKEGAKNKVVVISAMGKMTNAFEAIVNAYYNQDKNLEEKIDFVRNYHQKIIADLFTDEDPIHQEINNFLADLSGFMATNSSKEFNFIYDQIVGFGELISTKIVSAYLLKEEIENTWVDVRNCIHTNNNYRDAKVNWQRTQNKIEQNIDIETLTITQGFLGENEQNTTTLGREGSDFTAGIFAYCLNAQDVTIWKDVEGVLNADPRVFKDTTLLEQISYEETIEMAFYGASVIHPKTIKPLENKGIQLYVRSFLDTTNMGTKVSKGKRLHPYIPCFIVKKNQILISISANDFSFMVENNISDIFKKLHQYKLKVNVIQNSAISFSVCVDDKFTTFDAFYNDLNSLFKIEYTKQVNLYTIRHFNDAAIAAIHQKGKALLTQINKETMQMVIKAS